MDAPVEHVDTMDVEENSSKTMIDEDKSVPSTSNTIVIKEGLAEIEMQNTTQVFYNPVQEFNRDISVAVLNLIAEDHVAKQAEKNKSKNPEECVEQDYFNHNEAGKKCEDGIKILEALSATGLRGIRYAKEVAGVKEIVANDLSSNAVTAINNNIIKNNVQDIVTASHSDASLLMYQHRRPADRFHAIDLDPYGCPSTFLDAAVQSVTDAGILLVTCTDMAVLAGHSPETCYVKYGSVPLISRACHELALRMVLQCIQSHANRYGRYIVPLLSLSVDFYVRVIVQVFTSPSKCKYTTSNLASVFQCTGCKTMTLQPLGILKKNEKGTVRFCLPTAPAVKEKCQFCNHVHHVGGPIWIGPLHCEKFMQRLLLWPGLEKLGTFRRLHGILSVVLEELLDVPLYYALDSLCSILRVETVPMLSFRSALLNAGYRVSYSHANRMSVKTDAPAEVVWAVMRAWEKEHPAKRDRFPLDSPALAILNSLSPEGLTVSFEAHPDCNPPSRRVGLSRFPENPTAFWGPGTKAQSRVAGADTQSKSRRNQGKNQSKRRRTDLNSSTEEDESQKHPRSEGN
ncbi:hypothetical protein B566_EDAN008602 [Ephemera danica]|nr:hypothetical protein B566_EDAN008602 [Ephemera danica]